MKINIITCINTVEKLLDKSHRDKAWKIYLTDNPNMKKAESNRNDEESIIEKHDASDLAVGNNLLIKTENELSCQKEAQFKRMEKNTMRFNKVINNDSKNLQQTNNQSKTDFFSKYFKK